MKLLGVRVSRRLLVFALLALVAVQLYRRRGVGFPSFTFRQRAEP